MRISRRTFLSAAAISGSALAMGTGRFTALAQGSRPGVSQTEIRIGQTVPYSGPASAYGTIGKSEAAYFRMINDNGGINGRKINFISRDDSYSPPKTVEQTRKLVESDDVLLVFSSLGTPTQSAVRRYLNASKVPQLFVASGATTWGQPKTYPWTMGWQPNIQSEGRIWAKYILNNVPNPKIGILYQYDDYGKDYVKGLKDGLGERAADLIVSEQSYEVTDPTVDSQILILKSSGANVFYNITTPKFAAQAIRRVAEIGWKPIHLLNNVSASIGAVMKPAGFENAQGILSASYYKDPTDPRWTDDESLKAWTKWMKDYYPDGDLSNGFNVYGYLSAQTLVHVLAQCEDDLSRENVMRQAANLNFHLDMLLPGIEVKTTPNDFFPIEQMQLMRFEGERFVLFGDVIAGDVTGQ